MIEKEDHGDAAARPGPSSQATEPLRVSALRASVPIAIRGCRFELQSGAAVFEWAEPMDIEEVAFVREWLDVVMRGIERRARRNASAIEARRAETEGLGAQHESPALRSRGDAQ